MTIVTATRLEERAVRREVTGVRVLRVGVGRGGSFEDDVVSCGLAGGLADGVRAGDVLIPHEIVRESGEARACDPQLVAALEAGAHALGATPLDGALLTSTRLIRGASRRTWARRGLSGVDMETGLIVAPRLAAIRVILDSAERELSDAWLRPWRIWMRPDAWLELPWLAREAPRCARLAAQILHYALTKGVQQRQ